MTFMQPSLNPSAAKTVPLSTILLGVALLVGATFCTTSSAQQHGAAILKAPVGADGTSRAHVGETVTNFIRVINLDTFFDTLTITSIVDVVFSGTGAVTSPNLLGAPMTISFGQRIDVFHNYVVQPSDPDLLLDEAQTRGIDNRDGPGVGGLPDDFFLTFPGQLQVVRPCIRVTKNCSNGVGENGTIAFSGSVSNCGNTVLTNVVVSNLVNGTFIYVLGPTTLDPTQSVSFTGSYLPADPCGATDTIFAWGTDELGFTTNHSASATCSNIVNPNIVVTSACPPGPVPAETSMTISGTVTNTGDVTLNNVIVTNRVPAIGRAVAVIGPISLAPGAGMTFTDTFNVGNNCPAIQHILVASAVDRCLRPVTNSTTRSCPVECLTTNFCVFAAVSDPIFHHGGTDHAVWLPGISTNLIFFPEPGQWAEFPDGTARLTGTVRSRTNLSSGFVIDVHLSGFQTNPPPGSPKKDLDSSAYVNNGGPVNPATWHYYTNFTGTLAGFGVYDGAVLNIMRTGPAWQVGFGANNKNTNFGASAWFTWTVVQQRFLGPPLPNGQGDFNVDIRICEPAPICVVRAVSDPIFNPRGTDHAVWLPGISTNLIFFPEPGTFQEFTNGTAHLTGTARSLTNMASGFVVDVTLSGFQFTPPPGSPKKDLRSAAYIENGGPVNPATWHYYTNFSGTLTGFGIYDGAVLSLTRVGPAFQVGVGANNKNVHYGASAWFMWIVVQQPTAGQILPNGQGDFNFDIIDCRPSALGDFVWSDSNNNGLQDLGELGVPNVEVRLTDCSAAILEIQLTDGNGLYFFNNLLPGSYKVKVVAPIGADFALRNIGSDDTVDSDVNTNGYTPCLPLGLGETNRTVDAGLINLPAPAPPRLLSFTSMPSGDVRLAIAGETGRKYRIEASADLKTWRLITILPNINGTLQFADPNRGACCFYRLRWVP
jgi:hypothetical protein